MLTPNYGCVGTTGSDTVFTICNVFLYVDIRPRLFLAQTSLVVKKTTRTSGGDLISLFTSSQLNDIVRRYFE